MPPPPPLRTVSCIPQALLHSRQKVLFTPHHLQSKDLSEFSGGWECRRGPACTPPSCCFLEDLPTLPYLPRCPHGPIVRVPLCSPPCSFCKHPTRPGCRVRPRVPRGSFVGFVLFFPSAEPTPCPGWAGGTGGCFFLSPSGAEKSNWGGVWGSAVPLPLPPPGGLLLVRVLKPGKGRSGQGWFQNLQVRGPGVRVLGVRAFSGSRRALKAVLQAGFLSTCRVPGWASGDPSRRAPGDRTAAGGHRRCSRVAPAGRGLNGGPFQPHPGRCHAGRAEGPCTRGTETAAEA